MTATAGASFALRGVSVLFPGTEALGDVDLEIGAGELVALVGPSGSGKSTLLRSLNGTVRPSSGSVAVDGVELRTLGAAALRRVRARIGFIHQDLRLLPNLRVSQNVVAGRLGSMGFLRSVAAVARPSRARLREILEILERVGIPEKIFERTDRLSGGQQQRVAIARALYQEPRALLADEPVSAVDPARARDTVALLADVARETGRTLVMSLHNLELAREHFPRLVALRRGRVVFDRTAASLDDETFARLYRLGEGEMLLDGA